MAERSGAAPSRASTSAMSPSFTVEAAGKARSAPTPAERPSTRSWTHAARNRGPSDRAPARRFPRAAFARAATGRARADSGSSTAPVARSTRVTPAPAVKAMRRSCGPGATVTPKRTLPPAPRPSPRSRRPP